MKTEKFFGTLLTISALSIFVFNLRLTGAVVGISYENLNFPALIFLITGLALFLHGNRLELLSKKIIDKPEELQRISHRLGYNGRQVKEGYQIIDGEGRPLTVIPRHGPITTGTYHNIRRALMSGEPNFRKRYSS